MLSSWMQRHFGGTTKAPKSHLWEPWWLHTWYGTGWCCHVPLADGLSSWQQEEGLAAWQGLLLKAHAFPLHPQYQRMRTQSELLTKKPGTNVHIHDQTQYLIILYPWLFLIFKKISFWKRHYFYTYSNQNL